MACVTQGCDRPIWVKGTGECSTCSSRRWRRENPGQGRTVYTLTCAACGREHRAQTKGTKFCSVQCKGEAYRKVCKLSPDHPVMIEAARQAAMPKPAKPEPIDRRGVLRRAYDARDADLFFAALVARADTSGDCWVWPVVGQGGYPKFRLNKKNVALHRLVLEMKHGAPLGSQHAHHTCANAACVNPDHLQPVTHRDNVAEMLARHSYLARIRELETALATAWPNHPLLDVVAVA